MSRREFEQIDVKRDMGTKDALRRLAALMTVQNDGHPVHGYEAADVAIREAIAAREKGKPKRKR